MTNNKKNNDKYAVGIKKARPKCVNINCNRLAEIRTYDENKNVKSCHPFCSNCKDAANGKHPYRDEIIPVKKDNCEHPDCRWEKDTFEKYQLDLDHIDGDTFNTDPENFLTLCKNCHFKKSLENGDFKRGKYKSNIDVHNDFFVEEK